jgi:hypothetical protein
MMAQLIRRLGGLDEQFPAVTVRRGFCFRRRSMDGFPSGISRGLSSR